MFSIRLKELREKRGLSQYELADKLGVSQSAIGNWEAGKRQPNFNLAQKIAKFFGVTVDYLIGEPEFHLPPYKNIFPLTPYVKLPILGEIRAGNPIFMDQGEYDDWDYADDKYGDGGHFMLRVRGSSMTPTIPENSIAIIKEQTYAEKGQVAVVTFDGETATLKRCFPQTDGSILFRGDNPEAESYLIKPEQFNSGEAKIIGVLCEYKVKCI